jgi:hypothetical protein
LAAGGAKEAVAWPESFFLVGFLSSVLDAPVELRVGSDAPCESATRRSYGTPFPIAGVREKVDPVVEDLDGVVVVDQTGVVVRGAGWRRSGAEDVDSPTTWGLLPVQALSGGEAAGFAGVACCATKTKMGLGRSLLYFFSRIFCKNLG